MRRGIYILALALAVTGCEHHREPVDGSRIPIDVTVSVGEASSRAIVAGTSFAEGQNYGLFIYEHGTTDKVYNSGNDNMIALYSEGKWQYSYKDGVHYFPSLFVTNESNKNADFYAYAPWIDGVNDISAIPFTIGGVNHTLQTDMMYAVQNGTETNRNILGNATEGGEIVSKVTLDFKHALACLRFRFRLHNKTAPVKLSYISLEAVKDESTQTVNCPFYNKGYMNALTGEIDRKDATESPVRIFYNNLYISSAAGYDANPTGDFLIIPEEISPEADPDMVIYRVGIYLDASTSADPFIFDIKKSHLHHSGHTDSSPDIGFRAGYVYTFDFTIYNYIHLDGITIDNTWHVGEGDEINI